ncbi:hypothetical protein GCM10010503_40060 [Streptomyces lucensis JCM 4490]|uniref:Helicase-associated domain-containing protein n=1 Tax=Streptomyces lucensis JCM 4490 TaxID=1306176 RepID=A0A918J7Z7_9ACTN|nr:hypothetical protein GCM10010503_40060 [Streptomyces lucensis JCM 4490]
MHQGEDLGRWVRAQRLGFDKLTGAQQWLCEHIGIEPAGDDEEPEPRRSQSDKWAITCTAAKQFYERRGHLRVSRNTSNASSPTAVITAAATARAARSGRNERSCSGHG